MDPAVTTRAIPAATVQEVRSAADTADDGAMVSADFETFLRMLTTQLENQDPQNPMNSSDFAVQLATFAGVEQQVRSNSLLGDLVARSAAAGLSDFAGWVGMEARSQGSYAFDGGALELAPPVLSNVDRAVLVITASDGTEVGEVDIPNDGAPFTWLGTGAGGTLVPRGDYSFSVRGYRGSTPMTTVPIDTWGTVSEVRQGSEGPLLVMSDGAAVLASEVRAVRAP